MAWFRKKKKSARKTIEKYKNPKFESAFAKFPRKGTFPIVQSCPKDDPASLAEYEDREARVDIDALKLSQLKRKYGDKYSLIHTHPDIPLPSKEDIFYFLNKFEEDQRLNMIIAQRNPKKGQIEGYFFLKQLKEKSFIGFPKIYIPRRDKFLDIRLEYPTWEKDLKEISKYFNLKYRFVPTKGYAFDKKEMMFVKKENKNLEKKFAGIIAIFGFGAGMIFLSSNFTGNVIGNLTQINFNLIGAFLFMIGLVCAFYYFKKK